MQLRTKSVYRYTVTKGILNECSNETATEIGQFVTFSAFISVSGKENEARANSTFNYNEKNRRQSHWLILHEANEDNR